MLRQYILGLLCFGSRGAIGASSVRRFQKLPICPMEPMPAKNKTDLLLAKAELFHWRESSGEIGNEFELKKKGSTEEDVLKFIFNSHCIALI